MHSPRKRVASGGLTLVETIITMAVIGIMASAALGLYIQARAKSRALRCLYNQQQISNALLSFYSDHGRFPADGPTNDLGVQLSAYIEWPQHLHNVSVPEVYVCPNDRERGKRNSYQSYYVQRKDPSGSEYFVMGCPRHTDARDCYINLFGTHSAARAKPGRMVINGQTVNPEDSDGARSITSGTMQFEDGSRVTVSTPSAAFRATAVASFRQEDGRLYTIVRMTDIGSAEFDITPGSRFEVVTPAALIGVQGTRFKVETDEGFMRLTLHEGKVTALDRYRSVTHVLAEPGVLEVTIPDESECVKCAKHCKNGNHCMRCLLHVRKPENVNSGNCVECAEHCKKSSKLFHCHFCPLNLLNKSKSLVDD